MNSVLARVSTSGKILKVAEVVTYAAKYVLLATVMYASWTLGVMSMSLLPRFKAQKAGGAESNTQGILTSNISHDRAKLTEYYLVCAATDC